MHAGKSNFHNADHELYHGSCLSLAYCHRTEKPAEWQVQKSSKSQKTNGVLGSGCGNSVRARMSDRCAAMSRNQDNLDTGLCLQRHEQVSFMKNRILMCM